jgi:hypothetical protein
MIIFFSEISNKSIKNQNLTNLNFVEQLWTVPFLLNIHHILNDSSFHYLSKTKKEINGYFEYNQEIRAFFTCLSSVVLAGLNEIESGL